MKLSKNIRRSNKSFGHRIPNKTTIRLDMFRALVRQDSYQYTMHVDCHKITSSLQDAELQDHPKVVSTTLIHRQ